MSDKIFKITCSPECGFAVQSHVKQEVVAMAREHGKTIHKQDMANAEIERMVQTVS